MLILREVLGFSASEVAESLDTTVASVNSALQRARKTVDERLPEQSQQATLRALGDQQLREIVESYMNAMERGDVEAVIGDARRGRRLVDAAARDLVQRPRGDHRAFLQLGPLSGEWRWRHSRPGRTARRPSPATAWYEPDQAYLPFALDVLTLEGARIKPITSFITRSTSGRDPSTTSASPSSRWTTRTERRPRASACPAGLPNR